MESRTFKFVMKGKEIIAEYDTSQTVFGAIKKFTTFSSPDKNLKEIIITQSKGTCPGAVVKTDFPCCLVEDDEKFEINLYKSKFPSTNQETTTDTDSQSLVTFYIGTRGKTRKTIMKSSVYMQNNHYFVCVYSHKGVILKEALQHDGRFIDNIFDNDSDLIYERNITYKMNLTVDHCDGKTFELNVKNAKTKNSAKNNGKLKNTEQKTMQEMKTKVTDLSAKDHAPQNTAGNSGDLSGDSSQTPIKTEQEKKQDGSTEFTNPSSKRYVAKPIVNFEEILGILHNQFPVLLETLKQRENLKNKSEVQKFFRAEYGKSIENFLKVKNVKQLMKLSDSVCQIRQGESALGTGFLFFDRYILTNAHVIGESTDVTKVNAAQFTAVFGYEDMDSKDSKHIQVKQLTAYFFGKDDKGRYLDYALLELDDVENIADYPKLLDYYSPNASINKGQICIVGHPGGEVKKMDHRFIIERENRQKHVSENQHLINVINEVCLKDMWDFSAYEIQITYDSCFYHGSSGSPVFDADCNLIGIHSGGYKYKTKGDKTWRVMEYACSMQPILENIRAQAEIKRLSNIVSVIEAYSNESGTAEQQI